MLCSIIIPTFNRSNIITKTLDSILVQSYSDYEVIIVDDGSTDNTQDIILSYKSKFSNLKYFKQEKSNHKDQQKALFTWLQVKEIYFCKKCLQAIQYPVTPVL